LTLFLGTALGFGFCGQIIFYLQLVGNNFNHFLPLLAVITLLGVLLWAHRPLKFSIKAIRLNYSLLLLPVLAIPLWLEANYYPMGGWDAWSCWNLKAKFIYLGESHWKDIFLPELWRSNTGYPLSLPLINVWFWHWTGFQQYVPMFNTILLTLLTAGCLLLGLQELRVSRIASVILTLAIFTLALGNTLSISQYSDMLFSLYLLCALICYLLYVEKKEQSLLLLSALFIGLLSFTKNEGLGASMILGGLIVLRKPSHPWIFISVILIAALPTLLFTLTMAPKAQAFINGLNSADSPSTWERLRTILVYPFIEMTGWQWGGLWIAALISLGLNAIKKPGMIIGQFLAGYLSIVFAYYQINTFFEIGWWMTNTFNRIIFALMPALFLWVGLSVFQLKKDA
jgi:hypothetical protein